MNTTGSSDYIDNIAEQYRSIVCDCIIDKHPSLTEYHDCPIGEFRDKIDAPLDLESQLAITFHSLYDWLVKNNRLNVSELPHHVINRQVTYAELLSTVPHKVLADLIKFDEDFYQKYDYDSIDNADGVYSVMYIESVKILSPHIMSMFEAQYWNSK